MTEHRASFDATIRFSNGGDLPARGFRVDVPSPGIDQDAIAALFVASLGLLMTDSVTLTNVEIFAEPHKGTRGGPSDHSRGRPPAGSRLVELSHVIRAGMVTYPGLRSPAKPVRLKLNTVVCAEVVGDGALVAGHDGRGVADLVGEQGQGVVDAG